MTKRPAVKSKPKAPADGYEDTGEQVADIDEASEIIPFRYTITSYGADYPVDGLVKRLNSHDVVIPTFDPESEPSGSLEGFQRGFVWTTSQSLRFFAMFHEGDRYQESMKEFLNKFMGKNRDLRYISAAKLRSLFHETCDLIHQFIGARAFRRERVVNAAVLDSVMVGIARRLHNGGPITSKESIIEKYDQLIRNDEYQNAVVKSTADLANVEKRLKLAVRAFSKVR
jgi:hypothetical protein